MHVPVKATHNIISIYLSSLTLTSVPYTQTHAKLTIHSCTLTPVWSVLLHLVLHFPQTSNASSLILTRSR